MNATCNAGPRAKRLDEEEKRLQLLDEKVSLRLSLDDLRRILLLFKAVTYLMAQDDEPYLDAGCHDLESRLDTLYNATLKKCDRNLVL